MTGYRRHLISFVTVCALALCAFGDAMAHDEPGGPAGKALQVNSLGQAAIGVKVETLKLQSLPMEISVPGKIEVIPTRQFDQHAPLSGRIETVNVAPGEMVKQGQVLAVIISPEMNQLAAQLLQNRLDMESEIARQRATSIDEVRQAQEKFDLAANNLARIKKLRDLKIAPEKDVVAANSEYEISASRLNAATTNKNIMEKTLRARLELTLAPIRQRLEMLGVNESQIENMIKQQKTLTEVPVKAARSGFITGLAASAGKSIDPSVSLFTIADLSRVWATAEVYEEDMSRMHVGEKVHVMVHALQGEHVAGTITYIGTQVDVQTRTLPVRAEIANTEYRLKPDMYAELYIQTSDSDPMIAIPHNAVTMQSGHYVVFVETKDGYQPQFVNTGRNIGDLVEITHGLKPGQRVVTQGAFQLAAEEVKNSGGEALFASATEGERIEQDEDKKANGGLNLSIQSVVMIVAAAFIFGFAISAIFLFRGKARHTHESLTVSIGTGSGAAPGSGGRKPVGGAAAVEDEAPVEPATRVPRSKSDHV
ncbi:MAG TPA: efflux RND transporter periplasmic adaptor subunit [Candidatus Obscuribacterales bacterium]